MKTKLRSLRNESCRACRTERKKTLAEVTRSRRRRGRRSPAGAGASAGSAGASARRRSPARRASSAARRPCRPLRRPRCSWPSVARRRFICETARWTAARSWVGLVGRARSSSASGREGGRVSVRSIRSRSSSRRRWRSKRLSWSRSIGGSSAAPSGLGLRLGAGGELQRAADPLHVDADHARALALAAEGGDRQPRQVAHLALVAVDDRLADLLAQLVDVEPLAALVALLGLADPALDRLRLGGAEEPALEEQLEEPPVLLRLGDRRRQRLAEVVARGPGHLLERGEGVEDLRGADRDPLAAQLLAEAEQLRRQPRRAGLGRGP